VTRTAGWVFRTLFILAISGTFLVMGAVAGVTWYFSRDLPKIITVADYRPLGVTRIYGNYGREDALMGEFYKERRYVIPYEKMPEVVIRAFTSAEDDQFFAHSGINVASMLRAAIANFKAGHVAQGGSTITQQVVKSLLLTSERTFIRKIKEVIVASRLEKNLTKQQILYLYLNQIYLGHGAYGVQAAAQTYFRKDVSALSVGEAALLAGLPQAPGKYSPLLNPKRAKERQLYVLRRMFENKYISQGQMTEAAAQPIKIYRDEDVNKKYAAYLVEHLRRYLAEKYGEKALYEEALTIHIPASPELAIAASKSVKEGLELVDKRMGYRGPIQQLKSPEQIEEKLREIRLSVIDNRVKFKVLLPDGRMDPLEAMNIAGIKSDRELLTLNSVYQAVVTAVNDKKKYSSVMIGAVPAELPLEKMLWAKPVKDEKNPTAARGEPTLPSRVLAKGDLILVRVVEIGEKNIIVALDQEPQVQGALFSMEAQTGYVLAMEGGYDFGQSEFNRAIQAIRQPGSSFKPIIYSAALERGFTPASIIVDSPIVYEDSESGKWKPTNFEEKFYGDTTFRQALIKSRNVPTIKLVQAIQVSKMIEYARRLGMNAQFNADLSISLGSASTSLLELTKAYALFPRLGRRVTPIFLTKVLDRDGKLLEEQKPGLLVGSPVVPTPAATASPIMMPEPAVSASPISLALAGIDAYPVPGDPDQVMDPRIAYVMTHLMKEVVNYGTGHEAKNLGRASAGKTGTTNDYIDAWYMGFTPQIVSGVWVGFDNQRAVGHSETGARAALPIWLSYMRDAVKNYPDTDFTIPSGVVFASIDPVTGKLAPANASNAIREAFIEGTEPKERIDSDRVNTDAGDDFFKEDIE